MKKEIIMNRNRVVTITLPGKVWLQIIEAWKNKDSEKVREIIFGNNHSWRPTTFMSDVLGSYDELKSEVAKFHEAIVTGDVYCYGLEIDFDGTPTDKFPESLEQQFSFYAKK